MQASQRGVKTTCENWDVLNPASCKGSSGINFLCLACNSQAPIKADALSLIRYYFFLKLGPHLIDTSRILNVTKIMILICLGQRSGWNMRTFMERSDFVLVNYCSFGR